MAINNTNSNFVNIQSLPQTQYALNTDLIILQTENGTETITFDNFNVVKKDLEGNVSIDGVLSGHAVISDSLKTGPITASQYFVNSTQGATRGGFIYSNIFTVANGIVTSADFRIGSPEYTSLVNLVRTVSTIQNGTFKSVIEQNGVFNFQSNASASNIVSISLPAEVGSSIQPWHFNITPQLNVINFDSADIQLNNNCGLLGVAIKPFELAPGAQFGTLKVRCISNVRLLVEQDVNFRLLYFA